MSDEVLYVLTVRDAEALLERPLRPGEASSIRKTLEFALSEDAADAILSHDTDESRPDA